MDCYV